MQMSPKTVNYGGKNLGFGEGRFLHKKLGFGVSFGYRNNTTINPLIFAALALMPLTQMLMTSEYSLQLFTDVTQFNSVSIYGRRCKHLSVHIYLVTTVYQVLQST